MGHVTATDHRIKQDVQTCNGKECIKITTRGARSDGTGNTFLLKRREKFPCTGKDQHTLGGNQLPIEFLLAVGKAFHLNGVLRPTERWNDDLVLFSKARLEMPLGKGKPLLSGKKFPGTLMLGG